MQFDYGCVIPIISTRGHNNNCVFEGMKYWNCNKGTLKGDCKAKARNHQSECFKAMRGFELNSIIYRSALN